MYIGPFIVGDILVLEDSKPAFKDARTSFIFVLRIF